MQETDFDVVVIGAGIVGLATAYKLSKEHPRIKLAVLEKEQRRFRASLASLPKVTVFLPRLFTNLNSSNLEVTAISYQISNRTMSISRNYRNRKNLL